nr:reverse transcriptase domain-containing protein [Tanacetum cinerariifolium]
MKFSTPKGVATLVTRTVIIAECRRLEKKQVVEEERSEGEKEVEGTEEVLVNPSFPDQRVTIGGGLPKTCRDQLKSYPKDYYPLPNIDCKVESVGFRYKCFLDAYKGYHQIQMAKEDEEKMAFYTDQGTYCYTKMPFGLKNVGATYQRLVDLTFQSQIGRNFKAYVDDMVIKSKDEKMLLADIAETFDNLRKINIKLNPKKCSFEVVEGKFLGYMVNTDQPIKNNLNNTKTSEKLAKYAVELEAYNITFMPRNAMKGYVLAYFLSEAPKWEKEELYFQMPDVPLEKDDIKTLLAGLRIARQMNISNIEVKVDSKLVASQINGSYKASKDSMVKYLAKAKEYAFGFKSFSIENILRNMNQKADVLSKLALVAFNYLTKEVLVEVLNERSTKGQEVHTIVEEEGDKWMTHIIRCLEEGIRPENKNEARCLRAKIGQYAMEFGILSRRGIWKALRQGYYWPTMNDDAKKEVQKCESSFERVIHQLRSIIGDDDPGQPEPVNYVVHDKTYYLFASDPYQWLGFYLLGEIIVCHDYELDTSSYRWFGLPRIIDTDNGAQLVNDPFKSWCESLKFIR